MKIPHPIPYQGSKRNIAKFILPYLPNDISTLVEPFAGSAAISIAAACYGKASRFHLNDINKPLMALWLEIINDPQGIASRYEHLWKAQQGQERNFYDDIRSEFNRTHRPDCLLYLLARCVKASVRYNAKGEFNQSPDNRRLGRNPKQMADDIFSVSKLFRGRVIATSMDYKQLLKMATRNDLLYLDPPYQGLTHNSDPRYVASVNFEEFVTSLDQLNRQKIPFILSYDGRTGEKTFGRELPIDLELYKIEIEAGRSTQSTLLGRSDMTFESIYFSKELFPRLDFYPAELEAKRTLQNTHQLRLIGS